jgi:hypothetical protein
MRRIDLPETVKIVQGPNGPRFKGPAFAIRQLASSLRDLRDAPLGLVCSVGQVELYVSDKVDNPHGKGRVVLPRKAWNILASKFVEVATGWEESPFDFGDCGYLHPAPLLDLGVELVGEPEKDKENS